MKAFPTGVMSPRRDVTAKPLRGTAKVLILTALCCGAALAQDANKVSNFARNACAARGKETLAAAMQMPADKFSSKLSPQDLTFGQLLLHAATTNYQYCSKVGGLAEPDLDKISETDPKDKIIERLKSSFDFCTAALANLDDSTKTQMLTIGDTKTSRSMAILTLTGSWIDHIAMATSYLQANGLTVPTAKN
jgi:hypothetical protein